MQVTIFKVNGTKKKVEINCIKEIQFLVEGDIARIPFMDGVYFYNEEAADFKLKPNPHFLNVILGNVVELHGSITDLPYDLPYDKTYVGEEIEVNRD